MLCLHVCICTTCVSIVHGGQKKLSNPLELKLQIIVIRHVGAGNQIWVLCKKVPLTPGPPLQPPDILLYYYFLNTRFQVGLKLALVLLFSQVLGF